MKESNKNFPISVSSGYPNYFGLYNMIGNVNEWVANVLVQSKRINYADTLYRANYDNADTINYIQVDSLDKNTNSHQWPDYIPLYNNADYQRIYKGGSWLDEQKWYHPAQHRALHQNKAAADIGFRCAMTKIIVYD